MIDFTKLVVTYINENDAIECFKNSVENYNRKTNEISYPLHCKDLVFDLAITPNQKIFKGSLHKCWNFKNSQFAHNYNDFTFTEIKETVKYIEKKYLLKVKQSRLQNLEFGINLNVPFLVTPFLKNNLISNGTEINTATNFKNDGYAIQFKRTDCIIKIYNKIKGIRARYFHKCGINNLNDVLSRENLCNAFELLVKEFDKLIIIDKINFDKIKNKKHQLILKDFITPNFWTGLNKNVRYKKRKQLEKLLKQYQLDKMKTNLRIDLKNKFQYLISK